ncbi:hypothetical protein [Clostridium oceanicum]|uniref:Uncharacterized protein n=1 Tax=Clostridium oceanicum TaxID=1543 RepID=A0ABP3V537_9CLOT
MEKICPVCNEINDIEYICDNCGGKLVDKGRIQEYIDDYSADMPIDDYKDYCLHIFVCNKCGNKKKEYIHKVII